MNLTGLTIDAARSAVSERKTTALALAEAFYAKIESDDPKVGAYLILSRERALEKATEIDRLADKGEGLRKSLPHEEALANAPDADEEFFRVPKVIER